MARSVTLWGVAFAGSGEAGLWRPFHGNGSGVWVLQIPTAGLRYCGDSYIKDPCRDSLADIEAGSAGIEQSDRKRGNMAQVKLRTKDQNNIDGSCNIVREDGGMHYKDMRDSPELMELELLKPETGRDGLLPPEGPGTIEIGETMLE